MINISAFNVFIDFGDGSVIVRYYVDGIKLIDELYQQVDANIADWIKQSDIEGRIVVIDRQIIESEHETWEKINWINETVDFTANIVSIKQLVEIINQEMESD